MMKKKQVLNFAKGTLIANGLKMEGVMIEETKFPDADNDKGFHHSASFSITDVPLAQKLEHSKMMQPEKNRAQRRKEMYEKLRKAQRFSKKLRLAQKKREVKS